MKRYQRQVSVIGNEKQNVLNNASIMVVGLGGIGSPVAKYLAAAGIGTLILIDHDKVELTNLHRQILFNEDDVGLYKAERAKEVLNKTNSNINIKAYIDKFDAGFGNSLVPNVDLIIDGTDNYESRYLINDVCVLNEKVFISCSILVNIIQLVLFDTKCLCYRCLYPNAPPAGLSLSCSDAGVLGTVTGIAGTMAANLALNYLLNLEEPFNPRVNVFDAKNFSMSSFPIRQNEECIGCRKKNINFDLFNTVDYGIDLESIERDKYLLVDIREQEERNITKLDDDFFFPLKEKDNYDFFLSYKEKKILLYCATGYRSKLFASELRKLGVEAYYLKMSLK